MSEYFCTAMYVAAAAAAKCKQLLLRLILGSVNKKVVRNTQTGVWLP